MNALLSITPYKELKSGQESIHEHISSEKVILPDKVIAYLLAPQPTLTSPGVYKHPFIESRTLFEPDQCTDGRFCWDRDTWKYVFKFNLLIPQEFIDHVMSDQGDSFIEHCIDHNDSWSTTIKRWKKSQGYIVFLPGKSQLDSLKDF